jgi:hypothetical protein
VRVANLEDVSNLAETFQRPANFDLAAFWEAWDDQETETSYQVTLRVAPELFPWLSRFFGSDFKRAAGQAGPPDEHGWRVLTLSFLSGKLITPHNHTVTASVLSSIQCLIGMVN